MKVAFIHNDTKTGTGAHYINDLIVCKLREHHVDVQSYYPHLELTQTPIHFRGINNILFFYSLLENRTKILKCDIIQGTTYTPLAFMHFSKPVVSHFGSTTIGFLKSVPKTRDLEKECAEVFHALKKAGVISETDLKTLRPLHDIVTIEHYAAQKADYVIATSEIVKADLITNGIEAKKIEVIHNAIEDYWFSGKKHMFRKTPAIVYLGRVGDDVFTMKIKGVDRLIYLLQKFPAIEKLSILMSRNKKLISWMQGIPHHEVEPNLIKDHIPLKLQEYCGSILLITSRYEGFSLSLMEGMSQGLVPVSFPVGVAPEVIENGVNGFLVENIYEAEEKIAYLLKNESIRKKMSLVAKKTAEAFASEILVRKMMKVYKEMRAKKKKVGRKR